MIEILSKHPLLLLFLVLAIGYPLGHVKARGIGLGVAAVLFVGLAFGALNPELKLPELVQTFGLVLFVYTIGLRSGPTFFSSFRKEGLKNNLMGFGVLALGAGLCVGLCRISGVDSVHAAGVFAGSLTNTPALANVLGYLKGQSSLLEGFGVSAAAPVVAYSLTYPFGVIGPILAIFCFQKLWRVDYSKEVTTSEDLGERGENLTSATFQVEARHRDGIAISDLLEKHHWRVMFARVKHGGHVSLATELRHLEAGDLVSVVGTPSDLARVAEVIGPRVDERLDADRSVFDFRRIFISNPDIVGRRIKDLRISQDFGALITRIKRGDVDFLPHAETVLELGDRVRVVAEPARMAAISKYFGDSYKALGEIDFMPLGFGVAIGLLLGMVPIPLPGGSVFHLGFAAGPLIAGLAFGAMERSSGIVWQVPYNANLTLRQLGLVLFLAGVGVNSGYAFASAVLKGEGLRLAFLGLLITASVSSLTLLIGHRFMKIPMGRLVGMLAAVHTQPAVLAFANEQARNEQPNSGYAVVFPLATIAKVLLAQLIL